MNRFNLKMFAIITMLIDHIAAAGLISDQSVNFTMRLIGRLAFPLFAYFVAEGIFYTRDIKKYAIRMAAFAVITEVFFDYAFFGNMFYWGHQNVMWTFLIAIGGITLANSVKKHNPMFGPLLVILGGLLALFFRTDYDMWGVLLVYIMYEHRSRKTFMLAGSGAIILIMSFGGWIFEAAALISLGLIYLYNGQKGRDMKYFFYAFYPVHLAILGLIVYIVNH